MRPSHHQQGDMSKLTGDHYDTASKGAVSDALKRALRTFGAQFGNSLYDKGRHGQAQPKPQTQRPRKTKAPASQAVPWDEWAMTIEETSPGDNFNRVKDEVWADAPQRPA